MSYAREQIENVISLNPYETEFQQAVKELLLSIEDILEKNPIYKENRILERLTEPDRQIKFRVAWRDDTGKVQVNRGYRVQFNNAIGPYKGGLRFHPNVNLSIIKFLGFEQIFKNALISLPIGGAKGGSDFDPKGKSDNEIMSFCQSFMNELFRYIGENTDVPAGDIGVGAREIGYLFGQYKRLKNVYTGVLTGKGLEYGGSLVRKEATGFGLVYIVQELLKKMDLSLDGMKVSISGAGNVAIYAAQKAMELGAKVVTMSDSSGWIYSEEGLDLSVIKEIKEVKRGRIRAYLDYYPKTEYHEGRFDWSKPCDVALPCATQNELDLKGVENLIGNKVLAVAEGANMPTTPEGIELLHSKNIPFIPGKAANAGGVSVSALEMSQNSIRMSWTAKDVDSKLKEIMHNIFELISVSAEENGCKGNFVKGANIAGFKKVARAIIAQGVV
jgi:Glutamate dehydrogenase/leucine dehydrogenase